jgi:hypothetical protein
MLNWIKDAKDHLHLGGENGPRLRGDDAERLEQLLGVLYPKEKMLAYKVRRYIERDLYPECLGPLRELNFGRTLLNEIQGKLSKSAGKEFLTRLDSPPPGVLRRFGEVAQLHPGLAQSYHYYPKVANPAEAWVSGFFRALDHLDWSLAAQGERREPFKWGLRHLAEAARENGQDPVIIADFLLSWATANQYGFKLTLFRGFPDLAEFLADHAALVNGALTNTRATDQRMNVLNLLGIRPEAALLAPFTGGLLDCARSGNRSVRENALPLARVLAPQLRPRLEAELADASADTRLGAAQLLGTLFPGDEAVKELFTQRAEAEKSGKVKEVLTRYLLGQVAPEEAEEGAAATPADSGEVLGQDVHAAWKAIQPAPLPPAPDLKLPDSTREQVEDILRACDKIGAELKAAQKGLHQLYHNYKPLLPEAGALFEALQGTGPVKDILKGTYIAGHQELFRFAALPEINLYHLVRWIAAFRGGRQDRWLINNADAYFRAFTPVHGKIDLRELARALKAAQLDPNMIGEAFLIQSRYNQLSLFQGRGDHHWPYFAENLRTLGVALGLEMPPRKDQYWQWMADERRRSAYRVLASMPALPPAFIPLLWEMALAGPKKERVLAQRALDSLPGKTAQIVVSLASGKQENRASAALWLGETGAVEAVPHLTALLAKEKQDIVKGAVFVALEKLGVPLEEFLDRAKLETESRKAVAKGLPKDAQWLPLDTLPAVRWADSGERVAPAVIQNFIGQAVKLKLAEPPVLIRRYCEFMNRADLAALGKYLFQAWLAQDTLPRHDSAAAGELARKETDQYKALAAKNPQWYPNWDEQVHYKLAYNRYLNECLGSAIDAKGLLGLCACMCTGEVAAMAYAYIKKWYGQRAAQCRALLVMLAHVPDRSAIQVLLTVGNRFRTKSIQEEARLQAQLLAEREGWTMDELADRTIPTAGFDEERRQELDFGPRQFTARLTEDLSIEVETSAGKSLKALPDPAQGDDAELAKSAKKALSDAKKELKQVLALQKDRLYEAMCTQRTWKFEDWDAYLNRHPIVGSYAERLVWRVVAGAEEVSALTFRPLADRSLTDHEDNPVEVPGDALIALAHGSLVSLETAAAWLAHFKDYDVSPLIPQFGRDTYKLPEKLREERDIKDFVGYMMEAFPLRTQATKLGYTRGTGEDGGYFSVYRKDFAGTRVRAVISFTGNSLPEENIRCALQGLFFESMGEPGTEVSMYWNAMPIPLKDVPPVLLSECYNDIRQVAAAGPGFDKDWRKKAEY